MNFNLLHPGDILTKKASWTHQNEKSMKNIHYKIHNCKFCLWHGRHFPAWVCLCQGQLHYSCKHCVHVDVQELVVMVCQPHWYEAYVITVRPSTAEWSLEEPLWCRFSHKYSQKTPHSSPVRARYGVSIVSSKFELYSVAIIEMLYVILWYSPGWFYICSHPMRDSVTL